MYFVAKVYNGQDKYYIHNSTTSSRSVIAQIAATVYMFSANRIRSIPTLRFSARTYWINDDNYYNNNDDDDDDIVTTIKVKTL